MTFADTGYLLGLLNHQDQHHATCAAWTRAVEPGIVTTEYVAIEYFNRLAAPVDREAALSFWSRFLRLPGVVVVPASEALFQGGLDLYRSRPDKAWSLTDCISFVVMRERGLTETLAYDRHFEQAGFRALLREEPPGSSAGATPPGG